MRATHASHAQESAVARFARRAIVPIGLTAGVAVFIIAFFVANTDGDRDVVFSDPAIEALIPVQGSEVLRQSQVGIDLVSGFEAELTINGVPIPPDEINVLRNPDNPDESAEQPGTFSETINRFLYQPFEGRAVPELKGDQNCAIAMFWPISDPDDIRTVEWCFNVA